MFGAVQIVCAGSLDSFQIFVWSVKTGRLLDILAAHEGPVVALAFSPTQALLASVSWDRTLRTWDVFSGKGTPPPLATRSSTGATPLQFSLPCSERPFPPQLESRNSDDIMLSTQGA